MPIAPKWRTADHPRATDWRALAEQVARIKRYDYYRCLVGIASGVDTIGSLRLRVASLIQFQFGSILELHPKNAKLKCKPEQGAQLAG